MFSEVRHSVDLNKPIMRSDETAAIISVMIVDQVVNDRSR